VVSVVDGGPHHCRRGPHGRAKEVEEAEGAPLENVISHDDVHGLDDGLNWEVVAK